MHSIRRSHFLASLLFLSSHLQTAWSTSSPAAAAVAVAGNCSIPVLDILAGQTCVSDDKGVRNATVSALNNPSQPETPPTEQKATQAATDTVEPPKVASEPQKKPSETQKHATAHEPGFTRSNCTKPKDTNDVLCLYTSHSLARGRGLSFWAKPKDATRLFTLPAFEDPVTVMADVNNFDSPPYEVKEMPGRGKGVILTRTIYPGDLLFKESPLYMGERSLEENFPSTFIHMQNEAVDNLPAASAEKFKALTGDGWKGDDQVHNIIETNGFYVDFETAFPNMKTTYLVVAPAIARTNHDCRPNAHVTFDPYTFSLNVHAVRTIYPGEELSISYLELLSHESRESRLDVLETAWGFKCSCAACRATELLSDESDARVKEINGVTTYMFESMDEVEAGVAKDDIWTLGLRRRSYADLAEYLITLYEQERLYASLGEAWYLASVAYSRLGNLPKAKMYARLALDRLLVYLGPHDSYTHDMREFLEDHDSHWSWRGIDIDDNSEIFPDDGNRL